MTHEHLSQLLNAKETISSHDSKEEFQQFVFWFLHSNTWLFIQ